MVIIGERINSTRKAIREALDKKDMVFLINEAKRQIDAGAGYIDINCAALMQEEGAMLKEVIKAIREKFNCGISIDSPDLKLIKSILKTEDIGDPFINSITAEEEKLKELPALAGKGNNRIIALTMDEKGMPSDIEGRLALADKIIKRAEENGVSKKNIYIDPLVKPISTEPQQAGYFLESIKALKEKGINTIGGLSNVSFGLPVRQLLNAVFIRLSIEAGIGCLIIDPTPDMTQKVLNNDGLPDNLFALAKDAILGIDNYSMNYIRAFREGKLNI